jgi:hypothetical protein
MKVQKSAVDKRWSEMKPREDGTQGNLPNIKFLRAEHQKMGEIFHLVLA